MVGMLPILADRYAVAIAMKWKSSISLTAESSVMRTVAVDAVVLVTDAPYPTDFAVTAITGAARNAGENVMVYRPLPPLATANPVPAAIVPLLLTRPRTISGSDPAAMMASSWLRATLNSPMMAARSASECRRGTERTA